MLFAVWSIKTVPITAALLSESTGGSVFNVNTIKAGELDWVSCSLMSATTPTTARASSKIRAHSPSCVRCFPAPRAVHGGDPSRSHISSFDDLKGKRFNVGSPGSGTRASMEQLLEARGDGMDFFSLASELRPDEHGSALCDGKIGGFFYGVGHLPPTSKTPPPPAAQKLFRLRVMLWTRLVDKYRTTLKSPFLAVCTNNDEDIPRTAYWLPLSPRKMSPRTPSIRL